MGTERPRSRMHNSCSSPKYAAGGWKMQYVLSVRFKGTMTNGRINLIPRPGLEPTVRIDICESVVLKHFVIKVKHGSWANLKGGGQLATKTGNGAQIRGMVPGLGSVSGCPHSPATTSTRCVWTQVHAGVVAICSDQPVWIGASCSTSSRGGRRAL